MKSIQDSLVAEIELSYRPAIADKPIIKSCLDASIVIRSFIPESTIALKEHFIVLYLNRAQRVIGGYKVSEGGLTSTVGDLRLIFSVALKSVATSFIVGHNHPSGNLVPSSHDLTLTLKLAEAGRLMGIKLMDHIIVTPTQGEYYSFADNGML
ncbi:MAG: JAB domain-containing protein [Chitinophagaceae bacterium]|nr:JAB domain-containing protein [Chitinophagaceae bacterium]MCA6459024.1 JAB domain-containing protein [Chitinophagaceae bacterium]MCA6465554.1 JAB domain-containing protein [Chitinophagaceae bacterium]